MHFIKDDKEEKNTRHPLTNFILTKPLKTFFILTLTIILISMAAAYRSGCGGFLQKKCQYNDSYITPISNEKR
jgi:hypothetical protein